MARKLKSDHVLFIATVLLVALSVVMVYSASAPVALQRYGQASFFVIRQVMWAALGLPMLWFLMKVDYRTYREPVFIWCCLGLATLALVAVLFSAPVNNAHSCAPIWYFTPSQVLDDGLAKRFDSAC